MWKLFFLLSEAWMWNNNGRGLRIPILSSPSRWFILPLNFSFLIPYSSYSKLWQLHLLHLTSVIWLHSHYSHLPLSLSYILLSLNGNTLFQPYMSVLSYLLVCAYTVPLLWMSSFPSFSPHPPMSKYFLSFNTHCKDFHFKIEYWFGIYYLPSCIRGTNILVFPLKHGTYIWFILFTSHSPVSFIFQELSKYFLN